MSELTQGGVAWKVPIRSIRFIHKAIQVDTRGSNDEAGRLAPDDMDGAGDLARRFDFLSGVVKTHEDGEENSIFPLVDERVYPVSAPYLLDHRTDQLHMREMLEAFERLATTRDTGERTRVCCIDGRQAIVAQRGDDAAHPQRGGHCWCP